MYISPYTPTEKVKVLEEWIRQLEPIQLQAQEHDIPILKTLRAIVAHYEYLSQLPASQRSHGKAMLSSRDGTMKLDGSNNQVLRDYAIVAIDKNHYGGRLPGNRVPIFDLALEHMTELERTGQVVDLQGNVAGSRDMVFLEHYVPFSTLLHSPSVSPRTITLDQAACRQEQPDVSNVGPARHDIRVFLRGAYSGSQPGLLNHTFMYYEYEDGEMFQELTVVHDDQNGKVAFSQKGDSGSVVFGAWPVNNEEGTGDSTKLAVIGQLWGGFNPCGEDHESCDLSFVTPCDAIVRDIEASGYMMDGISPLPANLS